LIPVVPFIANVPRAPIFAAVMSILALFITGVGRSRYSHRTWLRSGAEMVTVGILGTAAGLIIGAILAGKT
jgi:VIT1/CCC1 family predicted Fe2+/Mn2+ transporter